ncbi:hypothetical protein GGR50DRAFT_403066 [Xylaria sp. CBS 124048]|nr:hypothetical protein GGR50DRAFT_403066 [Xylaria sp. CBS 124048]
MPFPISPRQGMNEIASGMPPYHTTVMDPPRPAREGYEWVWFPAGYWAERETAETPSKDGARPVRWRKRSGKSSSDSPKPSPSTMQSHHLGNIALPEKTEKSTGQAVVPNSRTQTNTSSESGGSLFTVNHIADPPPPSPYLSEEAHVQSLQWPSVEAMAMRGSWASSSIYKQRSALSNSPLNLSNADAKANSDSSQRLENTSTDMASPEVVTMEPPPSPVIAKKRFINWRIRSEHLRRLKKTLASGDEYVAAAVSPVEPPALHPATDLTIKASPRSSKSHKRKLFSMSQWRHNVSNFCKASVSGSVHSSVRSRSSCPTPITKEEETPANPWTSPFPGNEARRVQTPHDTGGLDPFQRLFYSELNSAANRRPFSGQARPTSRNKTYNAKALTPIDSSSSTTPRPRTTGKGADWREAKSNGKKPVNGHSKANAESEPDKPTKVTAVEVRPAVSDPFPRPHGPTKQGRLHAAVAANMLSSFQFQLPEHLPTSPMCPANKRHTSGGTGVCVYHGRAKSSQKVPPARSEDKSLGVNGKGGSGTESPRKDSSETGSGSELWK